MSESWRVVWRRGFVPLISDAGLKALRDALATDDPRLLQGATSVPPPLQAVEDWPVEAACAVGYCGWQGDDLTTVAEVEEYFARRCFEADQALGEPAACRWFLNWWDEQNRPAVLRDMLEEVTRTLAERQVLAESA